MENDIKEAFDKISTKIDQIKTSLDQTKTSLDEFKTSLDDIRLEVSKLKNSQDYYLNKAANIEISQEDNDLEIQTLKRDWNRLEKRVRDLEKRK